MSYISSFPKRAHLTLNSNRCCAALLVQKWERTPNVNFRRSTYESQAHKIFFFARRFSTIEATTIILSFFSEQKPGSFENGKNVPKSNVFLRSEVARRGAWVYLPDSLHFRICCQPYLSSFQNGPTFFSAPYSC